MATTTEYLAWLATAKRDASGRVVELPTTPAPKVDPVGPGTPRVVGNKW